MANIGILYVIGTDIGNKKYLSPAVKDALNDVEWVLTEHIRRSSDILNYLNIKVKQIVFNLKNEKIKTEEAFYRLSKGDNLGLLSDAGMPIVSDPGTELVNLCLKNNIKVKVISGTSSIVHALAYSGFPNVPFYFGGFLTPSIGRRNQGLDLSGMNVKEIYKINKKNEMIPAIEKYVNNILHECSTRKGLSIFFINGMHLDIILTKSEKILPINTQIAICSELTRDREKIHRGTCIELKNILEQNPKLKLGEHVIIFYIKAS
jgi:16S rRNA (cytidine1402-2'-O)-methyltransferase